jgi:hypothetical protein
MALDDTMGRTWRPMSFSQNFRFFLGTFALFITNAKFIEKGENRHAEPASVPHDPWQQNDG